MCEQSTWADSGSRDLIETYIEPNEQKIAQCGELTRNNTVKAVKLRKEETKMKQAGSLCIHM